MSGNVTRPMTLGAGRSLRGEIGRPHKYWHYVFVVSLLLMLVGLLGLLNARYGFSEVSSYSAKSAGVSQSILVAGYLGMFFSIAVLPIPDYILVPVYGYLSATGVFNPIATFLVCLAAAVLPIEYVCGRLIARPIFSRSLSFFRVSQARLEFADEWLAEHGKFSIFISTFIPFFYSAASLAAGTLRMSAAAFLLDSAAGFGVRFVFLEYVGYYGVYVFTASFDGAHAGLLLLLVVLSAAYICIYLVRTSTARWRGPES